MGPEILSQLLPTLVEVFPISFLLYLLSTLYEQSLNGSCPVLWMMEHRQKSEFWLWKETVSISKKPTSKWFYHSSLLGLWRCHSSRLVYSRTHNKRINKSRPYKTWTWLVDKLVKQQGVETSKWELIYGVVLPSFDMINSASNAFSFDALVNMAAWFS